jgi:multicomponent Na+:H+ antiporter subunit C
MSAATPGRAHRRSTEGLGLYDLITNPHPLRKILAFNLIGSDFFVLLGIIARKGAAAACAADPVPQAMVITGIVVAFSASAIAITLVLRLFQETGHVTLRPDAFVKPPANGADNWYM